MFFGECPYCDAGVDNSCDDFGLLRCKCESCGKTYWLLTSRMDAVAVTDERVRELADLDDETKAVRPKNPESFLADLRA